MGWGAHCGTPIVQGVWLSAKSKFHINLLELSIVRLAFLSFSTLLIGSHILLATVNNTTKFYIEKGGQFEARIGKAHQVIVLLWTVSFPPLPLLLLHEGRCFSYS